MALMENPNVPMGGQPPMGNPMGAEAPMGAGAPMKTDDTVLDMHLTDDVKRALQENGVDVSSVADRGPKEPVVVIPVSIIISGFTFHITSCMAIISCGICMIGRPI